MAALRKLARSTTALFGFGRSARSKPSPLLLLAPPSPAPAPPRTKRARPVGTPPASLLAPAPALPAPRPSPKTSGQDAAPAPASNPAKPAAKRAPARQTRKKAPTPRVVRVENLSIHAVERPGRRMDEAIILIHGAGLDHRDWTYQFIDALPTTRRVIAFDRPGFGASGRPAMAGGLPSVQARLLRKAAEEMGVKRAVLVGHSWGGAVAMSWGLDAPEQTIGVVSLAGAVAPWSFTSTLEHNRRMRHAAQMAFRPGGMRAAAMDGLIESFAPAPLPEGYVEHIATDLRQSRKASAMVGDVAQFNGALGLLAQRYADFDRPVALLYGDQDRVLSPVEQGEAARKALPNATLTILEGAGHMIHHTHGDACRAAIRKVVSAARWGAVGGGRKTARPSAPRPDPTRRIAW